MSKEPTDTQTESEGPAKKPENFWDSYYAMAFLVISILFCRFYVFEPFKIPSGSMEPTLFGHEDYGDRIVTNKLAYSSSGMVWTVLGVSVVLIIIGALASRGLRNWRGRIMWALISIAVIGGIGFCWSTDAVAGQPQRFDVVVFQYNTEWASGSSRDPEGGVLRVKEENKKINYIKRLVGLPGDTIVVNGGDLFLRKAGTDEIIRKWEVAPDVQKILWYPISKAWSPTLHEKPKTENKYFKEVQEQIENLAFPWSGADEGVAGVKREPKALRLDGSAPVNLTYKYPTTNIYLKQGRWPFTHVGCPEAHKEGIKNEETGITIRNPDNKSEDITAYVSNTWEGVQCPNCKQVQFPLTDGRPASGPYITRRGDARFYYGGDHTIGDLKLDLDVVLEAAGGAIQIQVGSNEHSALWTIGDGIAPVDTSSGKVHPVQKSVPALSPGKHVLSLAYIDATVIAQFDGQQVDLIKIPVTILGEAADNINSIARVSFSGVKGQVTRLDLYRDLYYTSSIGGMSARQTNAPKMRWMEDNGKTYVAQLPQDMFLMMGDNSPSSSDGRVWGFVPRSELVGRASFVWWPPSRWRFIKSGEKPEKCEAPR